MGSAQDVSGLSSGGREADVLGWVLPLQTPQAVSSTGHTSPVHVHWGLCSRDTLLFSLMVNGERAFTPYFWITCLLKNVLSVSRAGGGGSIFFGVWAILEFPVPPPLFSTSNRRRLPSNRRRLPFNRRRLPPTAVGSPPTVIGYTFATVGFPSTVVGYPPTAVGCPSTAVHLCA